MSFFRFISFFIYLAYANYSQNMLKRVYAAKKGYFRLFQMHYFRNSKNQPEGANIKEESESEQNDDEESESEQHADEENENIEQQPSKSNQLSCGEICGSVRIDDSSINKNTRIKQYISMLNDEMNNLLKQTKLNVDVIEVDSKKHYKRQFKNSS